MFFFLYVVSEQGVLFPQNFDLTYQGLRLECNKGFTIENTRISLIIEMKYCTDVWNFVTMLTWKI